MAYVSVIDTQPEGRSKFSFRILDKDYLDNSIPNDNSTIIQMEDSESKLMQNVISLGGCEEYQGGPQLVEQDLQTLDVKRLLNDHISIIRSLRENAIKCKEDCEDEGIFETLMDKICLHEQIAWTLRSYIENEPVRGESQEGSIKNE